MHTIYIHVKTHPESLPRAHFFDRLHERFPRDGTDVPDVRHDVAGQQDVEGFRSMALLQHHAPGLVTGHAK